MSAPTCRACAAPLDHVFVDLGMSPLANSYVPIDSANAMERFFPLRVLVCNRCLLVQLEELATPGEIFSDYAYFSSWSSSWLDHAHRFADMAIDRFALTGDSMVVELASNDGYLLRWFVERGIPVLGVEPASNVAAEAVKAGIPTIDEFFGVDLGRRLADTRKADLIAANNVLAHVPDLHDFVGGIASLLADDGWVSLEFPHLLRLMADAQYDTIYHEHFSYFSLHALLPVLEAHGLRAVDVTELPTHGGSLRLFLSHSDVADGRMTGAVDRVLDAEATAGLTHIEGYAAFADRVAATKRHALGRLFDLKEQGLSIAGYGAPAKANTLLNYCGIRTDLVDFTVDQNPVKQQTLLPGSRIPVLHPDALAERKPDVVWLLPWNLRDELEASLGYVRDWGGRFLVLQPEPDLR